MKATLFAFLPVAILASCTNNTTSAQQPTPPLAQGQTANPYGVPGQSDVGQYTPEATPYQQVQPINPPALPPGSVAPPSVHSSYPQPNYQQPQQVTPSIPRPNLGGRTHTVVKGDSLWGLSRKYNISADAIRSANGMAPGDNIIRTGQSLQIPSR